MPLLSPVIQATLSFKVFIPVCNFFNDNDFQPSFRLPDPGKRINETVCDDDPAKESMRGLMNIRNRWN